MSKIIMCELFSPSYVPSLISVADWIILATVCDFPEPVEPTIAICLLKNLFPLTGTEISGFEERLENVNFSCSAMDCE